MDQLRESKLRFFSVGIVAKDKERGTDIIDVMPVEHVPHTNGLVTEYKNKMSVNSANLKGVKSMAKVEGQSTMKATWLPFGASNRMSSPDVIENETVVIWRYADTDTYYWTTMFREPLIRRLETVMYAYGDLRDKLVPFTRDSSYWFEVSTHDKYIHLHTSNSDGEPFIYDIKLDTAYGSLTVQDNIGNSLVLDSPENSVTVTTNLTVALKTKHVGIECQDMVVKASQQVVFDTPIVYNTGEEVTALSSTAHPHYHCAP